MDNYNEEMEETEEREGTTKVHISNYGNSIRFDVEGFSEYQINEMHRAFIQHLQQSAQATKEKQLLNLVALAQILLFLLCGWMAYGQLQRTGGEDNKQSQIQYQYSKSFYKC